jgi:hypothetical protein
MRMVLRREHARFRLEANAAPDIELERPGQHLERDLAAETRISRAKHFAHAARTERLDHLVDPKARPTLEHH